MLIKTSAFLPRRIKDCLTKCPCGKLGGVREDSSPGRIQPAPLLLSTKKYYWIPRGVWLCLLLLLYYKKIQLLTIEKELFELSWPNWVTSHSSWEASKIKTSKTNRWIIIVTDYQTWPAFWPASFHFLWYISSWIFDFSNFKT